MEIMQIIAEWRTPGKKHFRVRTGKERIFHLTYDEIDNDWKINELEEA